jgi:hypothetical protein
MIEVTEVISRSTQGITKPFLCRCADDKYYYVKGAYAGRESQLFEIIAGRLGRRFGLPIPNFEIVDVPADLLAHVRDEWKQDLGPGPAFGSSRHTVIELTCALLEQVPYELQRDIFMFDLWIRNFDRTLWDTGGNPNLFWEPEKDELIVIDHNCAFDPDFKVARMLELHVFREAARDLKGDLITREEYSGRFTACLEGWTEVVEGIPDEWMYQDSAMTVLLDFDASRLLESLTRFEEEEFWQWT